MSNYTGNVKIAQLKILLQYSTKNSVETTVKIEVRTKQAQNTNYEYSHREKFNCLKNIIVK